MPSRPTARPATFALAPATFALAPATFSLAPATVTLAPATFALAPATLAVLLMLAGCASLTGKPADPAGTAAAAATPPTAAAAAANVTAALAGVGTPGRCSAPGCRGLGAGRHITPPGTRPAATVCGGDERCQADQRPVHCLAER